MKTQEEIEQLAANLANPNVCKTTNWIEGYTQCQQDMADKKYNLEDIKKAFLNGCVSERRFTRRSSELESYINSLNKQD